MNDVLEIQQTCAIAAEPPHSPWFAVRTKPQHEKKVARILDEKGVENFLPLYKQKRRWADRFKDIELPLFPGYIFSRFSLDTRLPVLCCPGVLYVVGVGRVPVAIEENEIGAVQRVLAANHPAIPWPRLEIGQAVRIRSGPLTGIEGNLIRIRNEERLAISVTLLQRSVLVDIGRETVEPVSLGARFIQTRAN